MAHSLILILTNQLILIHRVVSILALPFSPLTRLQSFVSPSAVERENMRHLARHNVAWNDITEDVLIHRFCYGESLGRGLVCWKRGKGSPHTLIEVNI